MSDDGTTFEIDLPVVGQNGIDSASKAIDLLQSRLDAATKAVQSQSAAYKTAESVADKAAKAYEKLNVAAQTKGGDWVARAAEAKTKADQTAAALDKEAAALDALTAASTKATATLKAFKTAQTEAKAKADGLRDGLRALGGGAIVDANEKVAKLQKGFTSLRTALGGAGPYVAVAVGLTAISVAMLAVAAAAALGVIKFAEWAVGMADTQRSARLLASGGFFMTSKAGNELYDTVSKLTKKFPLTREELTATAKSLAYYGLQGKDLSNALEHSAMWAARMKFGPDFAKQMLSLDEQSKVFHQNLMGVFGGLKIDPLLKALQLMVSLLDESTASGRAIKVIFESLFQPMIDGVAASKYKVEAFFLDLEIWALKALIVLKPHASLILHIGEAFAIAGAMLTSAALAAGIIALTAALIPFAVAAWAATAPILAVIAAFGVFVALGYQIGKLINEWDWDVFKSAGQSMVHGLVNGIKGAAGAVWDALKSVVTDAVDRVKDLLKINSPSKVFASIGASTGEGMSDGVDQSAPAVQNSMEAMASPPPVATNPMEAMSSQSATPTAKEPAAASGAGQANSGANFAGAHFVFHGVKDAEEAESRFGALLTRLIEGDVSQLGASVPG